MDNVRERKKVVLWGALIAAIAVIAGVTIGAFAFFGDRLEPVPATPYPQENVASDGCTGVEAQSIELNQQIVEPQSRTCFELADEQHVTIGAAALEPSDVIELLLFDARGEELAAAVSEPDWDPTVGINLAPGIYVIEVRGVGSDEVPPFLLHTATFPPFEDAAPSPGPEAPPGAEDLPARQACGADVPWLATGSPVLVSQTADAAVAGSGEAGRSYTCVEVTEPVLAKVGLESADPGGDGSADLTLAVYRFSDAGADLLRVADDTFGSDPEMSLELEVGVYLVEAAAWHDVATGDFEFYYDDTATLFREGEVAAAHADMNAEYCADHASMSVGDAITVDGERTYTCLEVTEDGRITVRAATLTDQDLTLEIIGFNEDGPYRLAWTDSNPYSQALIDFDPLLDQVIPAGTWVVAVTTYYGEPAADYDLQAVVGGAAS